MNQAKARALYVFLMRMEAQITILKWTLSHIINGPPPENEFEELMCSIDVKLKFKAILSEFSEIIGGM